MKTMIELPQITLERAKSLADAQGISVEQLLARAIEEKLQSSSTQAASGERGWMKGYGALADLKEENTRIMRLIEEEFEQIDPEDR